MSSDCSDLFDERTDDAPSPLETDIFASPHSKWNLSAADLLERSRSLGSILPSEEPAHIRDILDVLVSPVTNRNSQDRASVVSSPVSCKNPQSPRESPLDILTHVKPTADRKILRGSKQRRHLIYSFRDKGNSKSYKLEGLTSADLLLTVQATDDASDSPSTNSTSRNSRLPFSWKENARSDDLIPFSSLCQPNHSRVVVEKVPVADVDDGDVFDDSFENYDVHFTQIEKIGLASLCPVEEEEVPEIEDEGGDKFWGFSTPDKTENCQRMNSTPINLADKHILVEPSLDLGRASSQVQGQETDLIKGTSYVRNINFDVKDNSRPESSENLCADLEYSTMGTKGRNERFEGKGMEVDEVSKTIGDPNRNDHESETSRSEILASEELTKEGAYTVSCADASINTKTCSEMNTPLGLGEINTNPSAESGKVDNKYRQTTSDKTTPLVTNVAVVENVTLSYSPQSEMNIFEVISDQVIKIGCTGANGGYKKAKHPSKVKSLENSASSVVQELGATPSNIISVTGPGSLNIIEEISIIAESVVTNIGKESKHTCSTDLIEKSDNKPDCDFSPVDTKTVVVSKKSLSIKKMNEIEEANNKHFMKSKPFDNGNQIVDESEEKMSNSSDNKMMEDIKSSSCSVGFSTAGDSAVNVSSKNIAVAKKMRNGIDNNTGIKNLSHNKKKGGEKSNSCSVGFSTAGGNSVNVSDKSLAVAKKMMDAIDNDTGVNNSSHKKNKGGGKSDSCSVSFSTAGGSSVNVSSKSLAAAKKMMDAIDKDTDVDNSSHKKKKVNGKSDSCSVGFSTAGGNSVNVSSKSLAAAKKMMDAIDNNTGIKNLSHNKKKGGEKSNSCSVGFSTAGGNSVNVSDKSLAVAKKMMDAIDNDTGVNNSSHKKNKVGGKSDSCSVGFSTAGGNSVNVSSKSLAAAKKMMDAIDNDTGVNNSSHKKNKGGGKSDSCSVGFSTAGGNSVNVSSKSLAAAKKMMDAIDNDTGVNNLSHKKKKVSGKSDSCVGFSTAGGKFVTVSEKSLTIAKNMINDMDREQLIEMPKANNKIGEISKLSKSSLSSAKEKFITVADKSLAVDEEMVIEIDKNQEFCNLSDNKNKQDQKSDSCIDGFSTVGSKFVAVAKKSLTIAKNMMNNTDKGEVVNSPKANKTISQKSKHSRISLSTTRTKSGTEHEKRLTTSDKRASGADKNTGISSPSGNKNNQKPDSCNVGLSTTTGSKFVTVSKKSSAIPENRMDNVGKGAVVNSPKANNGISPESKKSKSGFLTATGKSVTVTEKSLAAAKKIMTDIDKEPEDSNSSDKNKNDQKSDSCSVGFPTAGRKSVTTSENNLAITENMMNNIGREEAVCTPKANNKISRKSNCSNIGFSTATNKSVTASKKSLVAAKKAMSGFEEESEDSNSSGNKIKDDLKSDSCVVGSSKAGSKFEAVSEKSLVSTDDMMNNMSTGEIANTPNSKSKINRKSKHSKFDFSTATGKSVTVSEKSLAAAKKMMNEINKEPEDNKIKDDLSFNSCNGSYSPTGGKFVALLEESLPSTNMTEYDGEVAGVPCASNEINNESKHGFSTAVHKSETFAVTKKVSNEVDRGAEANDLGDNKDKDDLNSKSGITGFSTAGGKLVAVSESSLTVAKNILNSQGNEEFINIPYANDKVSLKSKHSQFCFSTAGGNSVTVSEKSLAVAKEKMNEVDRIVEVNDTQNSKDNDVLNSNSYRANFLTDGDKFMDVSEECLSIVSDMINEIEKDVDSVFVKDVNCGALTEDGEESTVVLEKVSLSQSETILDSSDNERNVGHTSRICDDAVVENGSPKVFEVVSNKDEELAFRGFEAEPIDRPALKVMAEVLELSQKSVDIWNNMEAEISGSTAALLADELSIDGYRGWPDPYVTSPSAFFERPRVGSALTSLSPKKESSYSPICTSTSEKRKRPLHSSPKKIAKKIKSTSTTKVHQNPEEETASHSLKDPSKSKEPPGNKLIPGVLMRKRKEHASERISLRHFVDRGKPRQRTLAQLTTLGLRESVFYITSGNALDYKFHLPDYIKPVSSQDEKGLITSDGGHLMGDSDGCAGSQEMRRCLLTTPGVVPSLIPPLWVDQQYRWIVWKLAAMEKSFPLQFVNRCLNPEMVMCQLKYRYDREIDLVQRPILRKILEGDEPASRQFVCCVADIRKAADDLNFELELTDGWYSVWATVDLEMNSLVTRGSVAVGTKLLVWSAELINCPHGCDPLEVMLHCVKLQHRLKVGSDVRLKLSTNCCRRVRWWTRLGAAPAPPPKIRLSSVLPGGGFVAKLVATIARAYPVLYMSKDSEGKTVFRSWKAEEIEQAKMERLKNEKAELVYQAEWAEVEKEYKARVKKITRARKKDIATVMQPDVICAFLDQSPDPQGAQNMLSAEQLNLATKYRERVFSDMVQDVQDRVGKHLADVLPARNVTNVLKLRLVDKEELVTGRGEGFSAILTVWRSTEELCTLLTENSTFEFTNLVASGKRDGILQLATTKQTQYVERAVRKSVSSGEAWWSRQATQLSDLLGDAASILSVPFSEMDTVGVVVAIHDPGHPGAIAKVYLATPSPLGRPHSVVAVTFWTSLKVFGLEDTLKERRVVAACNLQWRRQSRGGSTGSSYIPSLFANETSIFIQNPKRKHLSRLFEETNAYFKKGDLMDKFVDECQCIISEDNSRKSTPLSRIMTPTGSGNAGVGGAGTPVSAGSNQKRRRLGLRTLTSCMESTSLAKRMKHLEGYGSGSPLPPISFKPQPQVAKHFKSPVSSPSTPTQPE